MSAFFNQKYAHTLKWSHRFGRRAVKPNVAMSFISGRSTALAWADIDNDGDQDLFIGTMAEKRFYLYINDGMGSFTEEAEQRGVALRPILPPFQTSTMTISVADYDKDGWLDFYTTEWLPHLDQSFDYNNASHSNCKLLRNLGGQGIVLF
jgi:hypothetical protein